MEFMLWTFASIGIITTVFVFMLLFLIISKSGKDPSEMTDKEFEDWHDKNRGEL